MSSRLMVAKKLSATPLSQQSPDAPDRQHDPVRGRDVAVVGTGVLTTAVGVEDRATVVRGSRTPC